MKCKNIKCNKEHNKTYGDGRFCSLKCASDIIHTDENNIFNIINWKEVQKTHDEGMLVSQIPNIFGFSLTTLRKAICKGLFIRKNNILHKRTLTKILKSVFKNRNNKGWKNVNKKTEKSYPEKFFSKIITNNKLNERYNILEQVQVSRYALDFVFVELKLDVEIDGGQHFRTKEAIERDKKRNEYLINNGWKVYRIAWVNLKNNTQKEITEFLDYLENIHNKTNRFYNIDEIVYKKRIKKYKDIEEYIKYLKIKHKEDAIKRRGMNKPIVKLILNSNIDFSKFGWVKKVANIIGIQSQHVNKWMKNNMFEFYEKNCFKKYGNGLKPKVKTDRQRYNELNYHIVKLIKNANIDYTKKGWINKIRTFIGNRRTFAWINKIMPELRIYYKQHQKGLYV